MARCQRIRLARAGLPSYRTLARKLSTALRLCGLWRGKRLFLAPQHNGAVLRAPRQQAAPHPGPLGPRRWGRAVGATVGATAPGGQIVPAAAALIPRARNHLFQTLCPFFPHPAPPGCFGCALPRRAGWYFSPPRAHPPRPGCLARRASAMPVGGPMPE